jgi:phosphotransferase system HPr-like phosphotransfer protein
LRITGLVASLACAGWSAHASLADQNTSQLLQTSLQQLSTGLQINSASDNAVAGSSAYVWQTVVPDVLALSYNGPLQSANLDQQLLQLLQGGNVSAANNLVQANQSALTSVATLQQASDQQSVLKLFSDNAAATVSAQSLQSLQSLQTATADQLSLSLVSQPAQSQVATLAIANQLPSSVSLVQACQSMSLSTGLKINQAVDPAQLALSTQNSLVLQLTQNNDGYDNTQGLNTAGLSLNNASLAALLTDAASQQILQAPLSLANFVTVGQLSQASALNFFNLSQSLNGNTSLNIAPEKDQFSTSVVALNNLNSPYLFVSIRDQWGADAQDYNTSVLAVNVGQANVNALCATPEPSLCLTLGGFMVVALGAKRRMNRRAEATVA